MSFEKHVGVMSSEYDSSFRILCGMDEVIDCKTGAVDEPIGHLTMVTIDDTNVTEVHEALHGFGYDVPSEGLYLVHENEFGMIVVFRYDTEEDRDRDWNDAEQKNLDEMRQWSSE